jgi:hypothetical protein
MEMTVNAVKIHCERTVQGDFEAIRVGIKDEQGNKVAYVTLPAFRAGETVKLSVSNLRNVDVFLEPLIGSITEASVNIEFDTDGDKPCNP